MSTKKAASEDKLGQVHDLMAERALDILQGFEEVKDPETGAVNRVRVRPSAADMAWIRAFLKDNDITCAPGDDNKLGELKRELERQRMARVTPTTGMPFDPLRDLPDGASVQ